MSWGYRIVLSFVVFVGLIVTLVVISMNQDINLVAEDYYKQEIEYQDQIDRIKRTSNLEIQPEITLNRQEARVIITMNQQRIDEGQAVFFRPADATQDRIVKLTETGDQEVSVTGWDRGLWKVKLSWKSDGKEYYSEKIITL